VEDPMGVIDKAGNQKNSKKTGENVEVNVKKGH
jgi:hypothetical protein